MRTDPPPTRARRAALALATAALYAAAVGCHHHRPAQTYHDDDPIAPTRVTNAGYAPLQPPKPLPGQDARLPPLSNDPAVTGPQVPELPRYVSAYQLVNSPKLMTLAYGPRQGDDTYLENQVNDALAANGRVATVSPAIAHQQLSADTLGGLESNQPQALSAAHSVVGAQVVVHLTARPSSTATQGLTLVAEAVDTNDGRQIATATAEVPSPADRSQLDPYAQFLARKLMAGMSQTWEQMHAAATAGGVAVTPPPAAVPTATVPPPTVTVAPTPAVTTPAAENPLSPAYNTPAQTVAPAAKPVPVPDLSPATRPTAVNPLDLPPPP